ncbi:MAG: hypothetical protein EOP49_02260 [Sphingobacteriales bacterium]|nr:MAG: hypothetical protein EOP49_02260 [Sphingobacteriales bacterium]
MTRSANVVRTTKETSIDVHLDLDGSGLADVQTPLPFLSHMVEQIARHGLVDLTVRATGDVDIDGHHTTEDLGFVLGQAVARALGDKAKIGTWDVELAEVFFEAFARGASCNLHVVLHAGTNLHHIVEICFKALNR